MAENHPSSTSWMNKPILNPCFLPGTSKQVEVSLGADSPLGTESLTVNMTGPSTSSASSSSSQCRALAEKTLKKDASCALAPCAFNGVHPLGMPESFSLRELKDLPSRVCAGSK